MNLQPEESWHAEWKRWLRGAIKAVSLSQLGFLLWGGCLILTVMSSQFQYGTPANARPILPFVGLMLGMSAVYLLAIWKAVRNGATDQNWPTILVIALAMRLLVVFSTPIQELDYYRYLWDGECVLAGVSPYSYSPQQVLMARAENVRGSAELARLIELCDLNPRAAMIASRVHYGQLPSIYPPVSLAVFACAVVTTPASASVEAAVIVLKWWIVLFDVGIILLLRALLIAASYSVGWIVVYAWCPLVIKEFANSGHLDAIAVFFMLGAVVALTRAVFAPDCQHRGTFFTETTRLLTLSGCCLGFGIGAKLFPIVLVPLMALLTCRRRGFREAGWFCGVTVLTAGIACWPFLGPRLQDAHTSAVTPEQVTSMEEQSSGSETVEVDVQPQRKSLNVFLTQWKMNDLISMFVEANLTPTTEDAVPVWSVVVPNGARKSVVEGIAARTGWTAPQVPFLTTRVLISAFHFVLALWWAWRGARAATPEIWLRYAFLTVAWFWAFSPTLNPWYWTWALPLVPFAGRRALLLVATMLPLYYLRFYFAVHYHETNVWGTPYVGEAFFHYVFVWVEHLPWMLLLMGEFFWFPENRLCAHSQIESEFCETNPCSGNSGINNVSDADLSDSRG